jgi:hypothetical protein
MTTYADPSRCPDCHAPLPETPQSCPRCALPLTGPGALDLFTTLQRADLLLADLRQQASLALRSAPSTVGAASAPGSLLDGAAPYPAPSRSGAGTTRRGERDVHRLTGASVPRILLTLGALCLLVAAVTFLAVAWSWLGVGGRTVVLLVLTMGALAGADLFARRGLRMAGEALSVVCLGLVALDVIGARHAGWLGDIGDAALVTTVGSVVGTAALAMLLLTLPRPLVAPAVVAPFAVLVAGVGAQVPVDAPVPMLVATLVLLGLGRVGVTVPSTPLWVSSLVAGAFGWLYLLGSGLGEVVEDQTVASLWGHGAVWPLLAAVAVAAAAAPVVGLGRIPRLVGYSVAALVGTFVVVAPALDNSLADATVSLLPCVLAWAAVATTAPERLRPGAVLPLAGAAVLPVAVFLDLAATALHATLEVGAPFTQPFSVHVAESSPWVWPWLAAPTLVTLVAGGCAAVGVRSPLRRMTWVAALGAATLVGAVVTLPLYDVPLALVVAVLLLVSCAGLAVAERLPASRAASARALAAVPGLLAVVAALPNAVMTTVALAVVTTVCVHLMRRPDHTGRIATAAFPFAFGGLVWAAADALSVHPADRALPILLVLGGLAIWRPEPVLETCAAVVGALASVGSVTAAPDTAWALAVYLTVAGALVTASSLIHPSRRVLAWPGGLLLTMATWVRLHELGVTTPEAYTLPAALVLTGVGVWRLLQDGDRGDTMRLLAPGLTLATVPSLLVALGDPVSLRSLLLGVGCLVLVLAGVALRWSAPVVVGSVVGALLVLRELAPYAADLPPWVVIGLSGTLLLVVGVTWESRMRDARTATRYVASLR